MVIRLLVAVAAASLGLLVAAPTAHADATDDHFLAPLKSAGITDPFGCTRDRCRSFRLRET